MTFEELLTTLEDGIMMVDNPHPALILGAKYLMTEYDRNRLPDWVEALANANPLLWKAAIDEVYTMICMEIGGKA
jgi:hypothetical protein